MNLPKFNLEIPKPKGWDLVAMFAAVVGIGMAGLNIAKATGGDMGALTLPIAFVQLAVCLGSLMLLGKTAKEGTIWGNLAAVGGMLIGMSGVLLATALWAAA